MIYPANYALIEQDELTYLDGGAIFDSFKTLGSDLKGAFGNFFSSFGGKGGNGGNSGNGGSGALGILNTGVTAYGAVVDIIHIPALFSALGEGYSMKEIAQYTFGVDDEGNVDTTRFFFNSFNMGAGLWALGRGGKAVVGLFSKKD